MTKIQNPKQKNNRFAKRPAGTGLKFVFLNLRPARSCLAMAGGFIWNLPARRFFGGVLGIWDFRHKTPKQSHFISNRIKGSGISYGFRSAIISFMMDITLRPLFRAILWASSTIPEACFSSSVRLGTGRFFFSYCQVKNRTASAFCCSFINPI